SPATRLRRTFEVLFRLRKAAREEDTAPAFSDPIERLERIHSFRIALIDPPPAGAVNRGPRMLLAVTFDHGFDTYLDVLWAKAGPILDLLLHDCLDYPFARDCDAGTWARWVERFMVPASYFYSATGATVSDIVAMRERAMLLRDLDGVPGQRLRHCSAPISPPAPRPGTPARHSVRNKGWRREGLEEGNILHHAL
ncbi:MAG: hypothetical protein SNJ63_10420, partial [Sphingomonadaceae bacterium]